MDVSGRVESGTKTESNAGAVAEEAGGESSQSLANKNKTKKPDAEYSRPGQPEQNTKGREVTLKAQRHLKD